MNIGYYYWGFLGDRKYNNNGELITAPDGNTIYSWAIINELQERGNKVIIFNDRDRIGFNIENKALFNSFASETRYKAYTNCEIYNNQKLDLVLIEWRWIIEGRNDEKTKIEHPENYQPDYENQVKLIKHCNENNIPFVVYDLDYKFTDDDCKKYNIKYVIESGYKLKDMLTNTKVYHIYQPFDFRYINEFDVNNLNKNPDMDILYIGNEYERTWAVEKYLPDKSHVYGNWLEPAHINVTKQFPNINFHKRINADEMPMLYNNSIASVLLAKKDYAENGFVTPRLTECILYGTVPLFMEEFGEDIIGKFAGKYTSFLTMHNKTQVKLVVDILRDDYELRKRIISYMREIMCFTDVKYFVNTILNIKDIKED